MVYQHVWGQSCMNRPLRIGLIAEGEAELGTSVPYVYDPKQGGTTIARSQEGALHTLIRRELKAAGLPECVFVHRHPTSKDNLWRYRTGDSVIDPKYLTQTIIAWKPEEIDMIVVVVDEDDKATVRMREVAQARQVIANYHVDQDGHPIQERALVGLAIKSFDTWLLADIECVALFLQASLPLDLPEDLEVLPGASSSPRHAKTMLDNAVAQSSYTPTNPRVQNRHLEARWELAHRLDLNQLKRRCVRGYGEFVKMLQSTSQKSMIDLTSAAST